MEIGAVKQAFNNELILLKKNLNQARTQIIHKLTRKAKQLTEKKCPDAVKEKFKRKAESAVKEVLVMKKIKPRDIGKFIVTHTGKLQDYLNRPQVDNDKACARLLLHKALQEKYKTIRSRFSNVPIKDLFMSRNERLKLKKEEQMKKKEKRDKKKKKGLVSVEGDWDVENVQLKKVTDVDHEKGNESGDGEDIDISDDGNQEEQSMQSDAASEDGSEDEDSIEDDSGKGLKISFDEQSDEESNNESNGNESETSDENSEEEHFANILKLALAKSEKEPDKSSVTPATKNKQLKLVSEQQKNKDSTKEVPVKLIELKGKPSKKDNIIKPDKKQKEVARNKNLNEKILKKKFKKVLSDTPEVEQKVVDPFFITPTGENYMSVVEPRGPDEVKAEHKQGNRKMRRAAMFGHVPKYKPKQPRQEENSFDKGHGNRFEKQNGFSRNNDKFNNQSEDSRRFNKFDDNRKNKFDDNRKIGFNDRSAPEETKPEKLHPSWEAKKKQSGILPFQGKKIVFNDG